MSGLAFSRCTQSHAVRESRVGRRGCRRLGSHVPGRLLERGHRHSPCITSINEPTESRPSGFCRDLVSYNRADYDGTGKASEGVDLTNSTDRTDRVERRCIEEVEDWSHFLTDI